MYDWIQCVTGKRYDWYIAFLQNTACPKIYYVQCLLCASVSINNWSLFIIINQLT